MGRPSLSRSIHSKQPRDHPERSSEIKILRPRLCHEFRNTRALARKPRAKVSSRYSEVIMQRDCLQRRPKQKMAVHIAGTSHSDGSATSQPGHDVRTARVRYMINETSLSSTRSTNLSHTQGSEVSPCRPWYRSPAGSNSSDHRAGLRPRPRRCVGPTRAKWLSGQALARPGLPVVTIRPTVFLEGFLLLLTGPSDRD